MVADTYQTSNSNSSFENTSTYHFLQQTAKFNQQASELLHFASEHSGDLSAILSAGGLGSKES